MKKLFTLIIAAIIMIGCTQSLSDTRLDEKSYLPVASQDSTQWKTVKMYEHKGDVIYLKDNKTVYKVAILDDGDTVLLVFVLLLVVFFVGLVVGISKQ